jgi:hypothetical protein
MPLGSGRAGRQGDFRNALLLADEAPGVVAFNDRRAGTDRAARRVVRAR